MKTRVLALVAVATVGWVGSGANGASSAARPQSAAAPTAPPAAQRAPALPGTLNVADWLDNAAQQRGGAAPRPSARRTASSADVPPNVVAPPRAAPPQLPQLHAPLNVAEEEDQGQGQGQGQGQDHGQGKMPDLLDAAAELSATPTDAPTDAPPDAPPDTPLPAMLSPTEGLEAPGEAREQAADTHTQAEASGAAEGAVQKDAAAAPEPAKADTTRTPAAAAPTTRPVQDFSPAMLRLRDKVRACLSYYYQRPERVEQRSPWGIMHSLISFGVDTELLAGDQRVNAIGWLCYNRPCRGITLMTTTNGQLVMKQNGPGYQGHDGQLLSMLALSGVPISYPIRVDGYPFTVADLVAYEQRTCKPKTELTFQLIGLAHYLPSDATWQTPAGTSWDIPRLIREELAQPIQNASCGGTHRLIGLSMAVKTRQKRGEPLDGEWLRAAKFTASYRAHALKLQNRDGSFSAQWLARRDDTGTLDRRLQTTGHILEWLVFSLPQQDLTDPPVVKSVNYLATLLMQRDRQWEVGPRGHALRALSLYNERVFGDKPGQRRELLVQGRGK